MYFYCSSGTFDLERTFYKLSLAQSRKICMTKIAARRDGNHLSVLAFARPRFEQSSSYGNKGLQKIILWVVNRPLFPRLHGGTPGRTYCFCAKLITWTPLW